MNREPLHFHFVRVAKQHPGKIVISDRGLQKKLSYRRALAAALLLAERLPKENDSRVGVMLPTSAGAVLTTLALLMKGMTPVFLNYATGVQANVEYARRKCRLSTIVTARGLLQKLNAPMLDEFICLEDILHETSFIDKARAAIRASRSPDRILSALPQPDIDAVAAILFTTGSEREPKAVPLTHRNILANLEALSQVYPFSSNDIMLASLPFFHVFGLTVNFWLPLRFGMTIVSHPNPLDFKTICTIIAEERPTYLVGTPSFLWGYLGHSRPGDFTSLKLIVTGADKCPDSLRQAYLEKHGLNIYEGFGTTETSPIITVNTPERNRPGSVGRVLPNLEIRIERNDSGEACSSNENGRILVKGESVFSGYLDDAETTARSFRNGWYDTGDIGNMDSDGFLWFVGRRRRMVKIGGETVSLAKVQDVLEKFLPPEVSCCVVGVPDAFKGAKIVAAVTQPINERQVIHEMSKELPTLALPKRFVIMEDLPKMASGKTDFNRTTQLVQEMIGRS